MPFGSVKYTERMNPWSTTSVTSQPACLRRSRRLSSASSSGRLNDRWSNWIARGSGTPAALANELDLDAGVLEEGDGGLLAEGEEVVTERRRADRGDELGAEHAVVEAHGGVHVAGDQGEVVDPPPVQCRLDAHHAS